jgi:hypothetical protein
MIYVAIPHGMLSLTLLKDKSFLAKLLQDIAWVVFLLNVIQLIVVALS